MFLEQFELDPEIEKPLSSINFFKIKNTYENLTEIPVS